MVCSVAWSLKNIWCPVQTWANGMAKHVVLGVHDNSFDEALSVLGLRCWMSSPSRMRALNARCVPCMLG
eukprot:23356-Chlamydomonas_euryale.AAC.1